MLQHLVPEDKAILIVFKDGAFAGDFVCAIGSLILQRLLPVDTPIRTIMEKGKIACNLLYFWAYRCFDAGLLKAF